MAGKKKDIRHQQKSALRVNPGVSDPESVSSDAAERLKMARQKSVDVQKVIDGIHAGERTRLSQAITMVESSLPADTEKAQKIISSCLPKSGKSIRIGITGVPGVGKSTFIEIFGKQLTSTGHRVAVLAVDPSSQRSKGSILGDKTRMEELSNDPSAFIRPSSSLGTLGGVARSTRESVILCEAAGFDVIIIETVGVGQSEVAVNGMVDFFLLLMLPGAGDELQGIKRGIMEMADAIVINKSDGNNVEKAKLARAEYENALHLFPPKENKWIPPVMMVSSTEKKGIREVWDTILNYRNDMQLNDHFNINRKKQSLKVMEEAIEDTLRDSFFGKPDIREQIKIFQDRILRDEISPYQAAADLVSRYLNIF